MKWTGEIGTEKRWRWILVLSLFVAAIYGLGVFQIFLLWWGGPSRSAWVTFVPFASALINGAGAGVLLGCLLLVRTRVRGFSFIPFLILSLVNFVVFTLLGKPLPVDSSGILEIVLTVALPVTVTLLVVLNACLLGQVLLPGRFRIPHEWRSRILLLLYGTLLGGLLLGFHGGIWRWGRVPVGPIAPGEPGTSGSLPSSVKFLETVDEWFPPKITIESWRSPQGVSLFPGFPLGFSPPASGKYRAYQWDAVEATGSEEAPALLHFGVTTRREEGVISPQEGQILGLGDSRLLLAKILPFRPDTVKEDWVGELSLCDSGKAPRDGAMAEPATTAVFYCVGSWDLEAEAVLDSTGDSVEGLGEASPSWVHWVFNVEPERIKSLRILKETEVFEVVFQVPEADLPGTVVIPNGLDIRVPGHVLESADFRRNPALFLEAVLGDRFEMEKGSTGPVPAAFGTKGEGTSIRGILNSLYPGRWWVRNGVVHTTRERFGAIGCQVIEAVQKLREE